MLRIMALVKSMKVRMMSIKVIIVVIIVIIIIIIVIIIKHDDVLHRFWWI